MRFLVLVDFPGFDSFIGLILDDLGGKAYHKMVAMVSYGIMWDDRDDSGTMMGTSIIAGKPSNYRALAL